MIKNISGISLHSSILIGAPGKFKFYLVKNVSNYCTIENLDIVIKLTVTQ